MVLVLLYFELIKITPLINNVLLKYSVAALTHHASPFVSVPVQCFVEQMACTVGYGHQSVKNLFCNN